jgi:RNA polymerase sigma-70 factor (ECF subfamily)
MTRTKEQLEATDEAAVAAAIAGDEAAFTSLTRRHRRELHVHCYRMLASFEDAEDLVQETFLRAWQKRDTFQGRASFRAWLYKIATNACLDFLARHERKAVDIDTLGDAESGIANAPHVAWLQPYPDRLIDQVESSDASTDAAVLRKETIALAYLVAIQYLPPKQRAVLILRDVLDWSAAETAELLDASVPAVNGALQRARATLRQRSPARDVPPVARVSPEQERLLVQQYVDATERCDTETLTRLLSRDAVFTMPPERMAFVGNEAVVRAWVDGGFGSPPYDDFKCLVTRANGMPAIANYIKRPGDSHHTIMSLDVLRIEKGTIAGVTAFGLENLVEAFGMPRMI